MYRGMWPYGQGRHNPVVVRHVEPSPKTSPEEARRLRPKLSVLSRQELERIERLTWLQRTLADTASES
jgi:hypothetical protein